MKALFLHGRLRWAALAALLMLFAGLIVLAGGATPAAAAPLPQPLGQKPDNSACLTCHGLPSQTWKLPSGEQVGISIDSNTYGHAAHQNFSCTTCHVNISGYPHPKNAPQTLADFRAQFVNACSTCHKEQASQITDSAHTALAKAGNKNTPTCVDCHNAHTQPTIKKDAAGNPTWEEKANIAKTCSLCHNAIYDQYINSVHGDGVKANNPDVPACNDCHGIHTVNDPTTAQFRLNSPELCAKCHTNEKIMSKYGISTQVLNTYVADFHGTTVTLFEKLSPDQVTNKPVCFDCHGVHDIAKVNDPTKGLQVKTNMLKACQKCHPDATTNFPDSWLSHYIPSPDKAPLVYYVNLFYTIFIPTVLGGMALVVVSDVYRKVRTARRKPVQKETEEKESEEKKSDE
jgi:predicted CXXCH cytochrome family protein